MSARRLKSFWLTLFFVVFLLIQKPICASAPLMHIYAAQKWIQLYENFTDQEKQAFYSGTLFPDIRYLAKIPRSLTHSQTVTIEEIKKTKDPFYKGMLLHSFLDLMQDQFYEETKALDLVKNASPSDRETLLKFLEDNKLFQCMKPSLINDIKNSLHEQPEELLFGVLEKDLIQWHETLSAYCSQGPYTYFATASSYVGLSQDRCTLFFLRMKEYKDDKAIQSHVDQFLKRIDNVFQQ